MSTAAVCGIEISDEEPKPVVFVTVGTTYHLFDRLMDWLEAWLSQHPDTVRMVVQRGPSRPIAGAETFDMCSHDELLALIRRSDVVIAQGGPGGIMDSRNCGIMPIVVPRLPQFHEVVDDHQLRFCHHMAREGLVRLATDQSSLHQQVDAALLEPQSVKVEDDDSHVALAVDRAGALIEQLLVARPPRSRGRRPRAQST